MNSTERKKKIIKLLMEEVETKSKKIQLSDSSDVKKKIYEEALESIDGMYDEDEIGIIHLCGAWNALQDDFEAQFPPDDRRIDGGQ